MEMAPAALEGGAGNADALPGQERHQPVEDITGEGAGCSVVIEHARA